MDIKETPKDFLKAKDGHLIHETCCNCISYIKRFSGSGANKTVNNLRVDLHQKITFPLRNFIIVLIRIAFRADVGGQTQGHDIYLHCHCPGHRISLLCLRRE